MYEQGEQQDRGIRMFLVSLAVKQTTGKTWTLDTISSESFSVLGGMFGMGEYNAELVTGSRKAGRQKWD